MDNAFTVTQVNRYIKRLLEEDALLCEIQVEGELSNFKRHSSGHLYFTLKDSSAAINAVMFASYAAGLSTFEPKNGVKVTISGHISLYEKTGQYQLYAVRMTPVGEGNLQAAFIRLRDALEKEGLFDPLRKKAIPYWANTVALVTSPTGAAVQDMIKVIRERNPGVKIVVVPTLVQGSEAAADIAQAIQLVNEWQKADVMIVGRGGGSIEDLWAFNEEVVARAIANSDIPVISAVGHETDFTIADFVADLRAPTPSAAAVVAVADITEVFSKMDILYKRANRAITQAISEAKNRLMFLSGKPSMTRPLDGIVMRQLHVQQLTRELEHSMSDKLKEQRNDLERQTQLLEKLSPYSLWKRGYATVCNMDGVGIQSIKSLQNGQNITIYMQDGEAKAQVLNVIQNRGE
ncbi:MAG: exodeoxyribonuclease VII large subunit [Defluviitaleaceae bacterium]|nr:exodeoxyribonuclease VII large subunit [Defluviitaleaceae bacterium]